MVLDGVRRQHDHHRRSSGPAQSSDPIGADQALVGGWAKTGE